MWKRVYPAGRALLFSGGLSAYQSMLISSWELNETSGTRSDSGPSSLTLADNNTVSYSGSITSNSRYLNGSTQYFTTPNASAYQLNSASYTLMSWFYKDALATTGCLVSKRTANGSADWEYFLYATSGNVIQFSTSGNATSTSVTATGTTTFTAKTWNCAMAAYDSSGATDVVYLNNGSAEGSASTTGKTPTTNTAEVVFGAIHASATPTYTNFFGGRLGAQAAFSGVLSSDERTELYNGGYQLRYDQLSSALAAKVLWWVDFNQTSGNETDAKTGATITAVGTPTYRCGIYKNSSDSGSARFVLANSERLSRTGGTVTGFDSITGNFSIEFAARFDSASSATQTTILGKGATSDSIKGVWVNKNSSDRFQITLGNGTSRVTVTPTNTVTLGALYHVVCTVNRSGNMIMYVNGSLGTGSASSSVAAISGDLGTIDLSIGGLSGSTFSEAEIGFVRIYNKELSSTEASYLYNSGTLRTYLTL